MNKETFCSLPFTEIFLGPDSEVKTCCSSREGLGNLKDTPVNEILDGKLAKDIRQSIIKGQWHPACAQCRVQEQQGALSERKKDLEEFQNRHLNISDSYFKLERLDLRWSNVCNLSCVYCYEYFSSKWAQIKGIKVNTIENINEESIFNLIKNNLSGVNSVMLLGGEPLLQKQNIRLLELLSTTGVYLLSNLSLDFEKTPIAEKLLQRNHVTWGVSFETIGKRYEYVRREASWEIFSKNIKRLSILDKKIEAHSMYSIYSAFNLLEFFEFLEKNKFQKVYWNLLQSTGFTEDKFNVLGLSKELKDRAIKEIDLCYKLYQGFDGIDSLISYRKSLIENYDLNYEKDIVDGIQKIENWLPYQQTFNQLWPDVFKI